MITLKRNMVGIFAKGSEKVNIIISAFQICVCESCDNTWSSSEEILNKRRQIAFCPHLTRHAFNPNSLPSRGDLIIFPYWICIRRQKGCKSVNPSQQVCQGALSRIIYELILFTSGRYYSSIAE